MPEPVGFGSSDNRRAHYEQLNITVAVYDKASEKYRAGDFSVQFPVGTYPPPLIHAATQVTPPTLRPSDPSLS